MLIVPWNREMNGKCRVSYSLGLTGLDFSNQAT